MRLGYNPEGPYELPSDVLSPDVTPALTRLFLTAMGKSILEQQDEIFGSRSRKISTLGTQNWGDGEDVGFASIRKLMGRVPNLLLQMKPGDHNDMGTALDDLWLAKAAKRLSVAVDSRCIDRNDFSMGSNFESLCLTLGHMKNLEALWVIHASKFPPVSAAHQSSLNFTKDRLLEVCCKLRYLKIGKVAWRVHRFNQRAERGKRSRIDRAERIDS